MLERFDVSFLYADTGASAWERYGLPWTAGERAKLLSLFDAGDSLRSLCIDLQRPPAGVVAKLMAAGRLRHYSSGTHYRAPQAIEINDQPTKEKDVSTNIEVSTKTYIGTVDASTLSDTEIFALIAKKEVEVRQWMAITNRPKKLEALIQKAEDDIQKLVAYVDGR